MGFLQRYQNILGAVIASAAVLSLAAGAAVWAADSIYVRKDALASEFRQQRLENLGDQIDELELKEELKQATPLDKAKLKQLRRKREEALK